MAPEYNQFRDNHTQYDAIEEWECLMCFKNVPTSGSSILYRDACNCADAGSSTLDHNCPQQAETFENQAYQYQPQGATIHIQSQSYASSFVSAPCPEGPELEIQNSAVTNGQLQVMVDPALDDAQYRLSSSAPPGLSLQMWRFLTELDRNRPIYAAASSPDTGFLAHDLNIPSKKKRNSNKRNASYQSVLSSSSDEPSFAGCDVDPVAGIGTWDDRGNYVYSSDEYPLTMSGLVDYPAEG